MVGQDLSGQRVLDAFAGSGLLGLEAWSRGATVLQVERSRGAVAVARRNASALGADLEVVQGDVLRLASRLGRFDGVLLDPPYAEDPEPILMTLAPLAGNWLTLEMDARRSPPCAPDLVLDRHRCYGGTALCVYRRSSAA